MLELLHEGHPGMMHMTSHARLHVWWPSINSNIEQTVRACTNCALMARAPVTVPLCTFRGFSKEIMAALTRHMDYARPFRGQMWLILIDAYSKWPEIHAMYAYYHSTSNNLSTLQGVFFTWLPRAAYNR